MADTPNKRANVPSIFIGAGPDDPVEGEAETVLEPRLRSVDRETDATE
jgi:hypothetical protein